MKNIILDFDNTMGVRGCDVDDGLALLYLLGNPERCRVLGSVHHVCGNAGIDVVDANTALSSRNSGYIPVYRGAAGPGDTDTEAARFLAEACAAAPGEISVLATGSTTNLAAAAARDEAFFRNAADFTLMGGITESLVINGRIMDELNFSCDADATFALLASGAPVTIATAQNCLAAHVTRERLSEAFTDGAWLMGAIDYWFADMGERYAWDGFAVWGGGRRGPHQTGAVRQRAAPRRPQPEAFVCGLPGTGAARDAAGRRVRARHRKPVRLPRRCRRRLAARLRDARP